MKQNKNFEKSRENYKNFQAFCEPFLKLKKEGKTETVNDCLIAVYKQQGTTVLKKYEDWRAEGKRIKKGAKGFYLWGQKETKVINNQIVTFYPMLVYFSDKQVF
ncbi:MAG: hypothetical protein LBS50_10555 [Prevotellaceae bacterium]|jgi:hypothetical protein|nr:hypothetical protein [Prevotellaceae bacterium]